MPALPSSDRGRWMVPLLLLFGVLAPTACVLWFMNIAVENQRDASRRKLAEAYRGQLTLLRARVDSFWEQRAAELEREAVRGPAPAAFDRMVTQGLADAVILRNADGSLSYPAPPSPVEADPVYHRADWMAARALESWHDFAGAADAYASITSEDRDATVAARAAQARIRCLMRGGNQSAALRAIQASFTTGRLMHALDLTGRLIAADEQLLAVRLGSGDSTLRRLLTDYQETSMPAAQRVFLMQELGGRFTTLAAERLAARYLETAAPRSGQGVVEVSGLQDVWTLAAQRGQVIALYQTSSIIAVLRGMASSLGDTLVITLPSGVVPTSGESIAAGSRLPGWQLSLSLPAGESMDAVMRQQRMSYLWIAILAIGMVAVTALLAARAFQRHWALAKLKTDLVAAVSHELKTPLASMRLLVDSLLDDEIPDARKTHEYLELIANENLRLSRLIENFLTFSRLERNRQKFEFSVRRPEDIAKAALAAAQERLQSPECHLHVDVGRDLPMVRADEDALVTVLLNLLDNAYKYTSGEKHISLRAFSRGGQVVFAVDDNGIGIPIREQKRIFRRFYQVDRRLARESGGCGLGLSIVDSIVKAHGGRVEVKSEAGKGSSFSVVLPASAAHGVAA